MKVQVVTTNELQRRPVETGDMVNLELEIGTTTYTLTEQDGRLNLSVGGRQLVAMPVGANSMQFTSN